METVKAAAAGAATTTPAHATRPATTTVYTCLPLRVHWRMPACHTACHRVPPPVGRERPLPVGSGSCLDLLPASLSISSHRACHNHHWVNLPVWVWHSMVIHHHYLLQLPSYHWRQTCISHHLLASTLFVGDASSHAGKEALKPYSHWRHWNWANLSRMYVTMPTSGLNNRHALSMADRSPTTLHCRASWLTLQRASGMLRLLAPAFFPRIAPPAATLPGLHPLRACRRTHYPWRAPPAWLPILRMYLNSGFSQHGQ